MTDEREAMTDPLEQAFRRLRDAADADEYVPTEQVIDTVLARLAAARAEPSAFRRLRSCLEFDERAPIEAVIEAALQRFDYDLHLVTRLRAKIRTITENYKPGWVDGLKAVARSAGFDPDDAPHDGVDPPSFIEDVIDLLRRDVRDLKADNAALRDALADIARGDYSDPLCQRTPEQRAREALTPMKEKP